MNLVFFSTAELSTSTIIMGILWCGGCLFFGAWMGWLLWRNTSRELQYLDAQNRRVQKDYEKREESLLINQEMIESMMDPTTNT